MDTKCRNKVQKYAAATKVNQEMLRFYWSLGKDMVEMHAESRWGSEFYDSLSKDLVSAMPDQKSFSPRNLRYMAQFYKMYSEIVPQAVAQLDNGEISPQIMDELCSVPWGHHRYIIDSDIDERMRKWINFHNVNYYLLYPLAAIELGAIKEAPENIENLFKRCIAAYIFSKVKEYGEEIYLNNLILGV